MSTIEDAMRFIRTVDGLADEAGKDSVLMMEQGALTFAETQYRQRLHAAAAWRQFLRDRCKDDKPTPVCDGDDK